MKAVRRYLRISPKKVNLVADLVRGKTAEYALNFLQFAPKKSAKPLLEAVRSAVANAENNFKQNKKDLFIAKIIVNEGPTLKRARPVSRGRSHPILKRTTHVTIELGVRAMDKTESNKADVQEKEVKKVASAPKKRITKAKPSSNKTTQASAKATKVVA